MRDPKKILTDIRDYLVAILDEWHKRIDEPNFYEQNIVVYNHIRKELDDLTEYAKKLGGGVVKRKIVKPYKKEQSFNLCVYECRVCGVTLKYGNTNEKNPSYPNFCWCCGTQLKEVDTKLFELWGIEP